MERLERASMPRATRCKSIAACCWLKWTICIRRIDVSNVADCDSERSIGHIYSWRRKVRETPQITNRTRSTSVRNTSTSPNLQLIAAFVQNTGHSGVPSQMAEQLNELVLHLLQLVWGVQLWGAAPPE